MTRVKLLGKGWVRTPATTTFRSFLLQSKPHTGFRTRLPSCRTGYTASFCNLYVNAMFVLYAVHGVGTAACVRCDADCL